MARRQTDPDKWERPWFRNLTPGQKLLWLYILDKCDITGIWYVDMQMASYCIGEPVDRDVALKAFSKQIEEIDGGNRWRIIDFVEFQYRKLTPNNNFHLSVLRKLKDNESRGWAGAPQGHPSPRPAPQFPAKSRGTPAPQRQRHRDFASSLSLETDKDSAVADSATPPLPLDLPEATSRPPKIKTLTDVQEIVLAYKELTGFDRDDKDWDRLNFSRCSRSANALLGFLKNKASVIECIREVYTNLKSKDLTVTIETVVKHAADWKIKSSEGDGQWEHPAWKANGN